MEKIRLDNGDAVYVNKKQINFLIVHKTFVEFNFCNGSTYIINKENCKNFISEIEKEGLKVNEQVADLRAGKKKTTANLQNIGRV